MANNRYASGKSDTTTVSGIKLLHRRKTTTEWAALGSTALTWGEFGIDTVTGEVRGYLIGGSNGSMCSWADATPIGSINLGLADTATADTARQYVYGVETEMEGSHVKGYKLLKANLPEISVEKASAPDDATFTVVSSIKIDENNPDKIVYATTTVPKVTIQHDAGTTAEFITNITGSHENGFIFTTGSQKTANGEANYDNKSGVTFIQGAKFYDNGDEHKADFKTGVIEGGDKVTVSATETGIKISVDTEGILAGVSGALSFAGTIDISGDGTNLDTYSWGAGVSRKIIATIPNATSNITSNSLLIHTTTRDGEHWGNNVRVKPGDLIVFVDSKMTDDPNDNQAHYCVIPSGDETDAEGTVKSVTAGDGLKTNTGTAITESGTIYHATAKRNSNTDYKVGTTPSDNGNPYSTSNNTNAAQVESEEYTFINYISLDKAAADDGSLGHVTDVRQNTVKILSQDSVRAIAQEESVTLSTGVGDFIEIEETQKLGTTPRNYDVKHAKISGSLSAEKDTTGTRNYLTGVTRDDYGHVTGYTYSTETVGDTWRPFTFGGTSFDGTTASGSINVTGGGYTKISVAAGTNNVTINTSVPTADSNTLGLVKVSEVSQSSISASLPGYSNLTLGSVDTFTAPVKMDANQKLYVTAYEHYVNKDANLADTDYNFCAIKRDSYGHIIDVASIDVIDGNY